MELSGTKMNTYGFSKTVDMAFEAALEKVSAELQKEGFGVLTSIDVEEILKKKLNIDFRKYKILGACNPPLAHKALEADEEVGLLLPCNVIVYEKNGRSVVAAFDPLSMSRMVDNSRIEPIAAEVRMRLERAIAAV